MHKSTFHEINSESCFHLEQSECYSLIFDYSPISAHVSRPSLLSYRLLNICRWNKAVSLSLVIVIIIMSHCQQQYSLKYSDTGFCCQYPALTGLVNVSLQLKNGWSFFTKNVFSWDNTVAQSVCGLIGNKWQDDQRRFVYLEGSGRLLPIRS